MVVQMEKVGAKSSPSIDRFDPSRTPISSISSNSTSAAYLANTSDSPGSTPMPTSARSPLARHCSSAASCTSPSGAPTMVNGSDGCGLLRVMAMST